MESYIVQKTAWFNAQPNVIWDMLTDPEKTKRYFFHCRVFSDWKPGSPIVWRGRMLLFKKIEFHGEILEAVPDRLLKYKLANASDDTGTISFITDTLTAENGGTLLSISDDVGQGPGAKERYERSRRGWDKVLKGLTKVVKKEIYK